MKKLLFIFNKCDLSLLLTMLRVTSVILLYSSCVTPYYDPYYVQASRQTENVYYAPAALNVPLLSNKNEGSATLAGSFSGLHSALDIQGAFSPSNHFGVMANYTKGTPGGNDSRYNRFELGAGYYRSLRSNGHVELYGGLGSGNIRNQHYTGTSHIKQMFYFLQTAIGLSNEKQTFKVALVSKISNVNFNVKDTLFDTDRENLSAAQIKGLYELPNHLYWEPGIVTKFGWTGFMFTLSYSGAIDLTNPETLHVKDNFSIGMNIPFNTTKKKKLN